MTSYHVGKKTSQLKSYYGSLSGSNGRSFRIRHEKVRAALPGRLTMTSYPFDNKTSLSRNPCIADRKLLWVTFIKSWSFSNFCYSKNSEY